MYSGLKHSPSEADIPRAQLRPVPRPLSSKTQREQASKTGAQALSNGGPAPWLSSTQKSSRIVLRELGVTKDIMMREQLVRQLKQVLPLIDTLAQDLLKAQDSHKQAQVTLEAAKAMSPSRMKKTGSLIGLTIPTPTRAEADLAVTEAEVAVTEAKARLADLTKRMKHHVHHVRLLVNGLQQATLSIVEGFWIGVKCASDGAR